MPPFVHPRPTPGERCAAVRTVPGVMRPGHPPRGPGDPRAAPGGRSVRGPPGECRTLTGSPAITGSPARRGGPAAVTGPSSHSPGRVRCGGRRGWAPGRCTGRPRRCRARPAGGQEVVGCVGFGDLFPHAETVRLCAPRGPGRRRLGVVEREVPAVGGEKGAAVANDVRGDEPVGLPRPSPGDRHVLRTRVEMACSARSRRGDTAREGIDSLLGGRPIEGPCYTVRLTGGTERRCPRAASALPRPLPPVVPMCLRTQGS